MDKLNPSQKISLEEALALYEHIELEDHELKEAILWRKQKKEAEIKRVNLEKRAEENRKMLTGNQWSYDQTKGFMLYRAAQIFTDKKFTLDSENTLIFELLCYYFSNDKQFIALAENAGIPNPSLEKGILLAGNFGVGKTWLMKLFARNQRQVFHVKHAKDIADAFGADGEDALMEFVNKPKNAINDTQAFLQPYAGLCIDDLGTEDIKNHYGNKRNVLGDLIEKRYAKNNIGVFLHATTNLDAEQIKSFYGGRVASRMREVFNLFEMNGNDRRK
jgi:DNA replication protein DnaC